MHNFNYNQYFEACSNTLVADLGKINLNTFSALWW